MSEINLDYFYGIEADQFTFFRIPKVLMIHPLYKKLSSNAKLLYGLMLDRMGLSRKNKWIDKQNRVYIKYSAKSVAEELGCSEPTALKALKELDTENGVGLIERVRIGQGNPDIIYVKNFVSIEKLIREEQEENQNTDIFSSELRQQEENRQEDEENKGLQEVETSEQEFENKRIFSSDMQNKKNLCSERKYQRNFSSREKEIVALEPKEVTTNNTRLNNTDLINTNPINLSWEHEEIELADQKDEMDETAAYMDIIKENIDYDIMMSDAKWSDRELYDELYQIICDVVCVPRQKIRIAGEEYPYQLVKSKFLKLTSSHLQYVIGCMRRNTTKIANIKAYLITALYNAPNTMGHYYSAEVSHDLYGVG